MNKKTITALPDRITARVSVDYDTKAIIEKMNTKDPTIEDVLDWVNNVAPEDLATACLHGCDTYDDNGNEI